VKGAIRLKNIIEKTKRQLRVNNMSKKSRAKLKASTQQIAETKLVTAIQARKVAGRKVVSSAKSQLSAKSAGKAKVGIIMGSSSDLPVMQEAADMLAAFGVPTEVAVVSAHRTPEAMMAYARSARERGLSVIIAGAGGAAHLPGMVAALTTLPVIGVPIKSSNSIDGWDSILSILQMPAGIPVATVALNGARNAAILAAAILGTSNPRVAAKLEEYKELLKQKVQEMNDALV
jgi:5-(carboxyamino)imidazole ribonucleotide mutase